MANLRLSGLASGMDTEAIVEQLMKAHRLKATKIEKKITTTEWKQEKWKELNSKIYSFYTNQLYKMRLQSNYMTRKAVSSNENKVTVSAGVNTPEGTHYIKVEQLASTQFVTGDAINKSKVSLNTKLADLGIQIDKGIKIRIKTGNLETGNVKTRELEVKADTTLGDFINALKNAGLNASYDETHKRIFISSKASGEDNAFTIEAVSDLQVKQKNEIRAYLNYNSLSSAEKKNIDTYLDKFFNTTDSAERDTAKENLLKIKYEQELKKYINEYKNDPNQIEKAKEKVREEISEEDENAFNDAVNKLLESEAKDNFGTYDDWALRTNADKEFDDCLNNIEWDNDQNGAIIDNCLENIGLGNITKENGNIIISNGNAKLIAAKNAKIVYNDVTFISSTNDFSINGLNISVKDTTENEQISITVSSNTEAVYNMIKDFIKSYNELLSEMNSAYYAASARGYEPLTDEEKEKMTDDQIEKWEKKIKDSLLRRDDTLGSLINMFRESFTTSSGKKYTLSSFGIASQNYSEKGILHISGDEDFSAVAALENKLKQALNENPEDVMDVFNKLADKLYSSLMNKMKSSSLSSAMTVYNDKELEKTLTGYKSDLKKMESKLADLEEKYYRQFSAMESALAKMNSQSSYLMSMLGMN